MKILFAVLLLLALLAVGPYVGNARGNAQDGKQVTVAELFHCHRHDDVDSDPPSQPLTDQLPQEQVVAIWFVGLAGTVASITGLCAGIAKGYRRHHRK